MGVTSETEAQAGIFVDDAGRKVRWYRSKDEASRFYYVPEELSPEITPAGKPTLMLIAAERGGILQLGTWWTVEPGSLERLQKHLAQASGMQPVQVRLSMAPATVKEVTLELGDGSGSFTALKSSVSSGYPPFATIFNVQLTEEEKKQVVAALSGRTDFLRVTYRGVLTEQVLAEATLAGDVSVDLPVLGSDPTTTNCREQLERAIEERRVRLSHSGRGQAPAELWQSVDDMAKERAVLLLQGMARNQPGGFGPPPSSATSRLEAKASLSEPVTAPFELSMDASTWFGRGSGMDHVQVMPGANLERPDTPPASGLNRVGLAFDGKAAPLSYVAVQAGSFQGALRAPAFEPVELPAQAADAPLRLKVSYTESGGGFECTLTEPAEGGWVLHPEDLGLMQVAIDGAARREAGAHEVRVRVRYLPFGRGTEDDRTLYLRGDTWTANYFVVTRSSDLAGKLEYETREITRNRDMVRTGPVATENPTIKL